MPAKKTIPSADHLYLQVADGLEQMIARDVLKIGDKLPSVRVLSEEKGISMSTAFQAYYHLEGKGLIEARPKSGYYVRFNHRRFPSLPESSTQEPATHEVSVGEMIDSIYRDIASPVMANFAIAVPHTSLLPLAKLNKSVLYALRNDKDHCAGYEDTQGHAALRQQLAKQAFNWGGRVAADDIVVTGGCLEAVTLSLKAVTQPGDTVAIEMPGYFGIYQTIESLGLKVVEIPASMTTGIDLVKLQQAIEQFSIKACVVVPNFSNPTGSCMPEENKKKLVSMITRHKIPLIEDDIYGELYFGRNRPRTCKYYDSKGWVIHCSSLSKSLAPGYRIGWVIPGRFFDSVKKQKRLTNISSPTLPQAAIAHFLAHGRYEYHLKHLRKALHTQCLRYTQAIIDYFPAGTRITRPQGGYLLWVELAKKLNTFALRTEAMKQKISIVPGKIFSASGLYGNCIRISFGRPWSEEVHLGLQQLGKLIKKMEAGK